MLRDEIREVKGAGSHSKKFRIYSKDARKPLESSEKESDKHFSSFERLALPVWGMKAVRPEGSGETHREQEVETRVERNSSFWGVL